MIRPPCLRPGSRVALVAPAGPLAPGALERAVDRVRRLGWEPIVGANAGKRRGYLAGSDEERLADLHTALHARENDAIWCLRGGYGTMRILPRIDFTPLRERPRPLIGFSDNTALHLALRQQRVVSFHGPHPAAPDLRAFSLEGILRVVAQTAPAGLLPFPGGGHARAETLVPGTATGPLVGGNLSLLAATTGTPYQMEPEGAILFLEEVGEPAYRVDRLLSQLLLAGLLDRVAGIAVGAFSECPDDPADRLPDPAAVVLDRLTGLDVPVAFGFPFGHIEESWTLPLGVSARLDASAGTLEILEPAVEP
jgi:muramoyltetrapeptide carboxypeptidase